LNYGWPTNLTKYALKINLRIVTLMNISTSADPITNDVNNITNTDKCVHQVSESSDVTNNDIKHDDLLDDVWELSGNSGFTDVNIGTNNIDGPNDIYPTNTDPIDKRTKQTDDWDKVLLIHEVSRPSVALDTNNKTIANTSKKQPIRYAPSQPKKTKQKKKQIKKYESDSDDCDDYDDQYDSYHNN
jgi:hypothetical protein